ncbi:hypothetical protein HA402_011673 [Bradysia odoriphaga]|nr:hypothetical protein HA402_011673 [Bradysia odoriphaga]
MYALCPPDFFGIGTECYYISQKTENWLDAHFDCKDRKSRLAEPNRYEDRMIRKFLVNNDLSKESKWIGGNYNWAQRKWQWQDGKEFTYQSFSQTPGGVQELQYHCAILNPNLKYRWSASSCVDKHQYICQHRMPYVNEKHRSRIYAKWNQTYPNEQATQVEVVINSAEMLKRGNRQSIPVNGRSTNTQRLSRHRNYLANEWLKKYKSQQIVLNRNAITNEVNIINTPRRKVPQRPNRLAPRRRNPSIGRDDFIQFERNKNVYRPLITNKVDDFDREESITAAPTNSRRYEQTTHPDRAEDPTSPPRKRFEEMNKEEKLKREEDKKKNGVEWKNGGKLRKDRWEEERLQNQIDEEKLRLEHEEELRRSRLQQEEQRRAEERKRIHDENLREREERMRMRELELKEREEEERKLREDEERRQEENRQRLEDIERQQREEEERKRQEAENKRIEEENKRRKNEELKEKMRQNRVDISNEDQTIDDLRLKEKLRREKNARMRERLSKLSPEEQLKFFELRRRNKKNSETQQK